MASDGMAPAAVIPSISPRTISPLSSAWATIDHSSSDRGLAHQVLGEPGGAVGRPDLAEHHQARAARPALRSPTPATTSTRSENDRSARSDHEPMRRCRWESSSVLEDGVELGQLGRRAHSRRSSRRGRRGQRDRPGPGAPRRRPGRSIPASTEQRPQVVGPVGHLRLAVGVRGGGEADPTRPRSARAARAPGTARHRACASRPRRPRPPPRSRRPPRPVGPTTPRGGSGE